MSILLDQTRQATLERLQRQLNDAYVRHKNISMKLQTHQDETLQKALYEIQKEILSISGKQKALLLQAPSSQVPVPPIGQMLRPIAPKPAIASSFPVAHSLGGSTRMPHAMPGGLSQSATSAFSRRPAPYPATVPKQTKQTDISVKKREFMRRLGLITRESYLEIQSRRSERKRRSTANPHLSYPIEPEKRSVLTYLSSPPDMKKKSHPTKELISRCYDPVKTAELVPKRDQHDDICAICKQRGKLLLCDTCHLVYHLSCLNPPLKKTPPGLWICPKCQFDGKSATDAAKMKSTRFNVREQLDSQNNQVEREKNTLAAKAQLLSQQLKNELDRQESLLCEQSDMEENFATLQKIIDSIQ